MRNFTFYPSDMDIADDSFHGDGIKPFTEWWYFDAVFDNGYSLQLAIRIISILKGGFAVARLDIYKDGELISHERKPYSLSKLSASNSPTNILLNDEQKIFGYYDKTSGNIVYELSFVMDNSSADLKFVSVTKGWKGKVPGSIWGVLLPKAIVSGKFVLNNKETKLKGIGYHDHNWQVRPVAVMNAGWFWGKIYSKTNTAVWSNIIETRSSSRSLLVVNSDYNGYVNFKPEDIDFKKFDIKKENGKMIPHSFSLNADNKDISVSVDMNFIDIHHVKIMGLMKYWRYHVKCIGSISKGSNVEKIDDIGIAELLRFR